ncbi:hypothetical protein [Aeoliella mucimassa]|uniref:MORN repeat variant n=1 Tax=Aeoliella mucimassa TaxID=2527972 RepID=A0A518AS20_9BACT|nr:hypothetical protein [Aeoliella mucimassa]QDU57506.1 hypothetical protein Pan181_37230 [Aeoliella mucimassa]
MVGSVVCVAGCSTEQLSQTPDGEYHGTGAVSYPYDGTTHIQRRDWYDQGHLSKSQWYKPDGTKVATTHWGDTGEGIEYYLYDDGSIHRMVQMEGMLAHGEGWVFDREGRRTAIETYTEGVLVQEQELLKVD